MCKKIKSLDISIVAYLSSKLSISTFHLLFVLSVMSILICTSVSTHQTPLVRFINHSTSSVHIVLLNPSFTYSSSKSGNLGHKKNKRKRKKERKKTKLYQTNKNKNIPGLDTHTQMLGLLSTTKEYSRFEKLWEEKDGGFSGVAGREGRSLRETRTSVSMCMRENEEKHKWNIWCVCVNARESGGEISACWEEVLAFLSKDKACFRPCATESQHSTVHGADLAGRFSISLYLPFSLPLSLYILSFSISISLCSSFPLNFTGSVVMKHGILLQQHPTNSTSKRIWFD